MAIKQGWTGRVFEDFTVGDMYEHPLGRTLLANVTVVNEAYRPVHKPWVVDLEKEATQVGVDNQ